MGFSERIRYEVNSQALKWNGELISRRAVPHREPTRLGVTPEVFSTSESYMGASFDGQIRVHHELQSDAASLIYEELLLCISHFAIKCSVSVGFLYLSLGDTLEGRDLAGDPAHDA
jgi:hypothetical protein